MAEKFSISAILSATDKNMSSTFKRAMGVAETFGDRVKSIVAGVGVTKALGAAMNTLTTSLDGAITRFDTLHTYPKIMKSLGFSFEDAQGSVSKLNAAVQGLPTSLADIVKSAQSLTAVTGNMDKATDTAIALMMPSWHPVHPPRMSPERSSSTHKCWPSESRPRILAYSAGDHVSGLN